LSVRGWSVPRTRSQSASTCSCNGIAWSSRRAAWYVCVTLSRETSVSDWSVPRTLAVCRYLPVSRPGTSARPVRGGLRVVAADRGLR